MLGEKERGFVASSGALGMLWDVFLEAVHRRFVAFWAPITVTCVDCACPHVPRLPVLQQLLELPALPANSETWSARGMLGANCQLATFSVFERQVLRVSPSPTPGLGGWRRGAVSSFSWSCAPVRRGRRANPRMDLGYTP